MWRNRPRLRYPLILITKVSSPSERARGASEATIAACRVDFICASGFFHAPRNLLDFINPILKVLRSMADWIEPPAKAPAFSLTATDGATVKLSELRGKAVVLYFYPKDDTPGCTKEACAFRDRLTEIQKLGAVVLGVSADDVASHKKFSEKFTLSFPLLADTDHQMAEKYGAWREKNMYGKVSMGIQRSTFLIDAQGAVAKVWKKVSVDGHDQQVIDALKALADG